MSSNVSVSVENLSIGYRSGRGEKIVAPDINAQLLSGELTCLLGPNGAGKSTLLRTLTGFQQKLGGSALIMGRDIADYTPAELAKTLGVVLTDRISVPDLTARQAVETGRSPYTGFWGRLSAEDEKIVNDAIDAVGITGFAGRRFSDLSDGERQKAMIAKALAQETPIIFLDEPTAFLDYPSKVDTMKLLRELARKHGRSVLMSTHDLELALEICDRVWLMDGRGNMICDTPEALVESGALARILNFTRNLFR